MRRRTKAEQAAFEQSLLPEIYYGLDLGQANDHTALAVLRAPTYFEKSFRGIPRKERLMTVGHLDRFPLRVSYPKMVKQVGKYIVQGTGKYSEKYLIVDRTGVGAAPLDMFEEAGHEPWGICSTAGTNVNKGDSPRKWNVPKRDLVSAAQVAMQTGRLEIASTLKYAKILRDELENFVVKFTPLGHDAYEAVKSGDHDDLVIALCLVVWAATTQYVSHRRVSFGTISVPRR